MVVAAFVAAMVIAAVVAFNARGAHTVAADQGGRVGTYPNGMIDGANLPNVPIAPLDPGFTGGPPLQPNMGTKPPGTVTEP